MSRNMAWAWVLVFGLLLIAGLAGWAVVNTVRGIASGPLIGGNISILCASLATPFQPVLRGAILFLEDLNEEP